jgi:hypothetical protein
LSAIQFASKYLLFWAKNTREQETTALLFVKTLFFETWDLFFFWSFLFKKTLISKCEKQQVLKSLSLLFFFIREQDYLESYSSNFLELQLIFLVKNKIIMIQQALDRISNWKYFSNFSNFTIYRSYRFSSDFRLSHVFTFPLRQNTKKKY